MTDLVDIGSAVRDPDSNTVLVSAKSAQTGDTEDDAPGFDNVPLLGQAGLVAIPWHRDSRGAAQGLIEEGVGGQNGIVTNWRDLRSTGVVEELAPGETAVHSTGPDFGSKVFLKKKLIALMIDDDVALVIDKGNERLTFTGFGHHFEISKANGVVITEGGGATSQWSGGAQSHMGQVVLGGRTPTMPVAMMAVPQLIGVAPLSPVAGAFQALGVFIGV